MQAILVTFGSFGDVQPMLALGRELQRRGLEATVMTNGFFETAVLDAGLKFHSVSAAEDYEAVTADKDLWHPRRGLKIVAEAWGQLSPLVHDAIAENYQPGNTVVVATAVTFGARVAQEHLGVPLATVNLQPAVFRSLEETPQLPGGFSLERKPRFVKRLVYWLADQYADHLLAGVINRHRSQFGLRPVRRLMDRWAFSPQLVIGLFPAWFATPQPDWPPQSMVSGFPLYDGPEANGLPENVEDWLKLGTPPIVFTAGTAMRHGKDFFAAAAEACRLLGRRGIFLTRYPEQLPDLLPTELRHFDYVRFSQLFPRCAAVVHHGGVGTTAQCFAAGVPQLVMPMGFDQPDNAWRAERLGVAKSVLPRAFRPDTVAGLLRQLLDQPEIAERCRHFARLSRDPQRLAAACEAICRLTTTR